MNRRTPGSSRTILRLAAVTAVCLLPAAVRAQSVTGSGRSLSSDSTNVHAGSVNVHSDSLSVHEGSVGSMKSGPVGESSVGGMHDGPVSELSVGPVSDGVGFAGNGSVGESSVGAVKKDANTELGERISQPLHQLEPLREQLRAIQPVIESAQASDDVETQPNDESANEAPTDEAPADAPGSEIAPAVPQAPPDVDAEPLPAAENEDSE